MEKTNFKGYFFVILSAVIFGLAPLFALSIYANGGDSVSFIFYRSLFSLPALFILMRKVPGNTIAVTFQELKKLFILSLANVSTSFLLLMSYNYVSSGTATTIHFIYPVFVLIACVVFFKDPLNKVKLASVIFSMIGIVMFYVPGDDSGVFGMVLSFVSGITYAFYVIYLSRCGLSDTMNSFKLIFWLNVLTSVESMIFIMFAGGLNTGLTGTGWIMTVITANIFALGFGSFQVGVKAVGPQSASILSTFEPITSVIVGVLVFKESFTVRSLIGIIAVLISVVMITVFDKSNKATH